MKGVHKEVQKFFGSNVQNYIIASRAAQGYEEWLQSSDAEKQDVIVLWKLIQKYLKKKSSPDEMVRDILEAQRRMNIEDREVFQNCGRTVSSAQLANSADASFQDTDSVILSPGGSKSPFDSDNTAPEESLGVGEINETIRPLVQETSRRDTEEDANVERVIQENVSHLQRRRQETADHQADQENLRQAMATSEAEAQRQAREALEYEEQLTRVIAQSLRERIRRGSDSEWDSDMVHNDEDDEELERATNVSKKMAEKAAAVAGKSPDVQHSLSYDPGHLAGTIQSEFEAQQQGQQEENTTQEKTEEEIVMEYVKKQSLLERGYQNKGKSRATATEDKDDEYLQKALKFSIQDTSMMWSIGTGTLQGRDQSCFALNE